MNLRDFKSKYNLRTPIKQGDSHIQGWQSNSDVFKHVITKYKPDTIIEVGSWLGASALHMASLIKDRDFSILCVDTFLGSNAALWDDYPKDLLNNFSSIYDQYCINITSHYLNDQVAPLPMTSSSAAELLKNNHVIVDMVYIDAGHRYRDVLADLEDWYPLANKVVVGDDYSPVWAGVQDAVKDFSAAHNISYEVMDQKFIIGK
jgi:cephalosporin hydroxylase